MKIIFELKNAFLFVISYEQKVFYVLQKTKLLTKGKKYGKRKIGN